MTSKDQLQHLTKALQKWHKTTCPTTSIDVVLTRPADSIEMGIEIGRTLDLIPKQDATAILMAIGMLHRHRRTLDVINRVCARAMNARKQGLLKTNGRTRPGAHQTNGAT